MARWVILLFFPGVCSASTLPVHRPCSLRSRILLQVRMPVSRYQLPGTAMGHSTGPRNTLLSRCFLYRMGHGWDHSPSQKLRICKSENTCMYRTSVEIRAFPAGTFMLAASDPLSGVTSRQMISIPPHTRENSEFFKQFDHDRMFSITSVLLGAVLVFVLAILIRENI